MSAGGQKSLEGFLAEAQEITDAFGKSLLELGKGGAGSADPETVNALFRSAHSLKGISAMFGVGRLSSLAHALEDLLDDLRMGRVAANDAVEGVLLDAVDVFGALIGDTQRGQLEGSPPARQLADALEARIHAAAHAPAEATTGDPLDSLALDASVRGVLTEYEEHRLRENVKAGKAIWRARAAFEMASFDRGLSDLSSRIKTVGEVVSTLPAAAAMSGDKIAFDLVFGSAAPREQVEASLAGSGAELLPVAAAAPAEAPRAPPPHAAAEGPRPAEAEAKAVPAIQTVRVDIRKLDRLMGIVAELVQAKSNLLAVAKAAGGERYTAIFSNQLIREGRNLERHLDELQAGILDVRMVPLSQAFDKLARMIRKVEREAGKELELTVRGGDVELDKLIVEELSDPLMHLIRNAVDHGIEAPERREKLGKPRHGRLGLSASQRGNHVVIELSDDGAGIDGRRVAEVAVERGLIRPEDAATLGRREVLNLIFQPGFSTARAVGALSGRGVGLDVVKTNIANLSGVIDVQSEEGRGTTMAITLPITLAILRALIVEAAGRSYAIPLTAVLEIASVRSSEIRRLDGREVLDLRGTTLPLVRLSRLFRLSGDDAARDRHYAVVVGLARERLGLLVDGLDGQRDVVLKPLGALLGSVRGIAGATDLGPQRTVLVVDVGAILEEVFAGEALARAAS